MSRRQQQLAQRASNELSAGTYSNIAEKMDWSYWDVLSILNTTLLTRMFTAPLGGAANRVLCDTNLVRQSIPRGQKFMVYAIKVFYYAHALLNDTTLLDFFTLIRRSTLDIKIIGKDSIGQWGLDELLGAPVLAEQAAAATLNTHALSIGRFTGIFPLNTPIKLAALTDYEIVLQHHTAPAAALNADILKISLNGTLLRQA